MADHAGALTILALALLLVWALHALQRRLASDSRAAEGAEGESAAGAPPPGAPAAAAVPIDEPADTDPRSGPGTRIHVPFLVRALLFAIALAGIALLVPWALAVRELGSRALLGLALVVGPAALGILHARARDRLEW